MLRFMNGLPKAVKSSGAVSPATLAMLSSTPVTMPLRPAGRITFIIVLGYETPKAKEASLRESGMSFKVSPVAVTITGSIINPRATAPERAEKEPIGTTTHVYAMIPMTMEGIPCNISMDNLVKYTNLPFLYSERKMPAKTPRGTEKRIEIITRINVPMIAFRIPPPVSPTGLGSWVRNFQLIAEIPLLVMKKMIKNIGSVQAKERRIMMILNVLSAKILLRIGNSLMLYPCPHAADDDFANDVYNSGDDEEDESQLNQTREV